MSLSITSVNNDAGTAKTYVLVGRDRTSSEWYNQTDETIDFSQRVTFKHSQVGKTSAGIPLIRTLAQVKASTILDPVSPGAGFEDVIVNLTITRPSQMTDATLMTIKDAVAYIRNALTSSVIGQLVHMEV